tara:strand:+ start:580 stop:792 length:213 start_codon:yes stop_codon:yes gene_type:complete
VKLDPKTLKVMEALADNMASYESVTWLGTPRKELDGKTPYDMLKKSLGTRVYALLIKDIKVIKSKKKKRS